METKKIYITDLNGLNKYLTDYPDYNWVYFGSNNSFTNLENFKRRYNFSRDLYLISLENKKKFLNWIYNVGTKQNELMWAGSNISYLCPLSSDLFLKCCYMLLVEKWLKEKKKLILVADDDNFIKTILKNFSDVVYVGCVKDNSIKQFLKNTILYSYFVSFIEIRNLFKIFYNKKRINGICKRKYKENIKNKISKSYDIFFFSWMLEYQFQNEKFDDKYLGRINEYFSSKGMKTIYLNNFFYNDDILEQIYKSENIIPVEFFFSWKNILKVFYKIIFVKWNNDIPDFDSKDLSYFLQGVFNREKTNLFFPLLFHLSVKDLLKELYAKNILYPHENQSWEKMINLAVKKTGNKANLIAYQHGNLPELYLNYFYGDNSDYIKFPDFLISSNEFNKKILLRSGAKAKILNGGSVSDRYNLEKYKGLSRKKTNNVLVILPYSISDSYSMLKYVIRNNNREYNFLIKKHPASEIKSVFESIGSLPDNFQIVDKAIRTLIPEIEYAIYFSTSAAVECMINGVKVIKYLPESIDLDTLLFENIPTVTDEDVLDLKKIKMVDIKNYPVREPINYKVWDSVIKK